MTEETNVTAKYLSHEAILDAVRGLEGFRGGSVRLDRPGHAEALTLYTPGLVVPQEVRDELRGLELVGVKLSFSDQEPPRT